MNLICTEVEGLSFVGSTGDEGSKPRSWNLQNLSPVPPYDELPIVVLLLH